MHRSVSHVSDYGTAGMCRFPTRLPSQPLATRSIPCHRLRSPHPPQPHLRNLLPCPRLRPPPPQPHLRPLRIPTYRCLNFSHSISDCHSSVLFRSIDLPKHSVALSVVLSVSSPQTSQLVRMLYTAPPHHTRLPLPLPLSPVPSPSSTHLVDAEPPNGSSASPPCRVPHLLSAPVFSLLPFDQSDSIHFHGCSNVRTDTECDHALRGLDVHHT